MAGIYLHIPYCRKACHYCNFHFSTTRYNAGQMHQSLLKEISQQTAYLQGAPISTIYFGGGTPSILPADNITELIQAIKDHYPVDNQAEITLEANPDDINEGILQSWQRAGVNRLSIGVQSFIQADLQWMNRAHTTSEAYQAASLARKAGIVDISIDLIYGTPYLTDEGWQENLDKVIELGVPHLSAYALTVEPKTALFKMIEKGKLPPVDGAKQSRQFELLLQWADAHCFEHYEISNLCLPGHRSRHNSSYWKGVPYLGIGPAAHSFDGQNLRKWNIDNNPLYIQGMKEGNNITTFETLTPANQINEMIMIELRLMEGLDLEVFNRRFGQQALDNLVQQANPVIHNQQAIILNDHLVLTKRGKHFADSIAVELFV